MNATQTIQEFADAMKTGRDAWTITWQDGDTIDYYGADPDRYARSTKEYGWGMTYTVARR